MILFDIGQAVIFLLYSYYSLLFQVPVFVGEIHISGNTRKTFAILVRPAIYTHALGPAKKTIMSEIDRQFRIEVPDKAVTKDSELKVQVSH